MSDKKYPISQKGFDKLKSELNWLETFELDRVNKKVSEAREKGDLSENAEYSAAREEQSNVNERIDYVKNIIANAVIDTNADLYFDVRFDDDEDTDTRLQFVPSTESDLVNNKIANDSVLAKTIKAAYEKGISKDIVVKPDDAPSYKISILSTNYEVTPQLPIFEAPHYDPDFSPLYRGLKDYQERVSKETETCPLSVCVERNDGYNYVWECETFKPGKEDKLTKDIMGRMVKVILWVAGGYKIYVSGNKLVYEMLKADYTLKGARSFDVDFMQGVYEKDFEVVWCEKGVPTLHEEVCPVSSDLSGCRIGFDAGGSDCKVSAVVNGEVIWSDETVWLPKVNADPEYHYQGILDSMKRAAEKMPRLDAIGVSSAGVYVNDRIMVASLFMSVPKDQFDAKVKDMYIRIGKEMGVPLKVANDGDVSALAGAQSLHDNAVLGLAMGTSEATGYVDEQGGFKGWLNELAFVPVDLNKKAMVDEWSGDYGCGVKYFSQDGVIKLADNAGIVFDKDLTPAQKLKVIQRLEEDGDERAQHIYEDLGNYLGETLPLYALFFNLRHVILMGRVVSGKGGDTILEVAQKKLSQFPGCEQIKLSLPDEMMRRVGQSIAAASLPKLK